MDPRMRVGDAERERAQSELARHYADGRLDHDEYCERLDAVWTARTMSDLTVLFADLPRPVVRVQPTPPTTVRRQRPFPWLPVLAVLIGLSILLDGPLWLAVLPLWWAWSRFAPAPRPPSERGGRGMR